jgi:hypothetical protein
VKSQSSSKHKRNIENYLAGAALCCFFSGIWLITESLPTLPGRWLGLLAASLVLMSVLLVGILWTAKYRAVPQPTSPAAPHITAGDPLPQKDPPGDGAIYRPAHQ